MLRTRPAVGCGNKGFYWQQTKGDITLAEERILDSVAAARERFNICATRIFVAGAACGGTMALRAPERFAGAVSICGPFPTGWVPLVDIKRARQLPLFIAHGRDDQRYTVERTCDELRLFFTAGLSVVLRQYPSGDEVTSRMLSDMDAWIMEQVTGIQAVRPQLPPFINN
jgi:phospholipase/carboxylesterase